MPRPQMTEAERDEAVQLYLAGSTVDDLCDKFDRSDAAIKNLLRKAGAKRPRLTTHRSRKGITGAGA